MQILSDLIKLPSLSPNYSQIIHARIFRPSQKCHQTGYFLPPVGTLKRPRQRKVRQERLHLPRPPDHPRPPRYDQRV